MTPIQDPSYESSDSSPDMDDSTKLLGSEHAHHSQEGVQQEFKIDLPPISSNDIDIQQQGAIEIQKGDNFKDGLTVGLLGDSQDSDDGGDEESDGSQGERPARWCHELFDGNYQVLFNSKLNILLFCIPFAIAAKYANWGDGILFIISLLSLCPLAERLGYLTEQLALHTNDTLGGLLNVTFGNAPEMIVCICALQKEAVRIVQLTLLGSVISNLLAVLGSSLLVGGLKNGSRKFKSGGLVMNFTMLILGCGFIYVPGAVQNDMNMDIQNLVQDDKSTNSLQLQQSAADQILSLSRFLAIVMLICYVLYVLHEFIQHHSHDNCGEFEDVGEDDEEWEVGVVTSILWLAVVGFLVSWLSDMLVGALLGQASQELNIPVAFMTIALVPIVGNAAEHAAAVMFAYKNKVELSLSVAAGSPTQLIMFVFPLLIVIAWMMGVDLTLDLQDLDSLVVLASVGLSIVSLLDYRINWVKGALMLAVYLGLAGAYWVHVDNKL